MRARVLLLAATSFVVGCSAVLGLDERGLAPNVDASVEDAIDDVSTENDAEDTSAPPSDSTVNDDSATDEGVDDSAADTTVVIDTGTTTDTGTIIDTGSASDTGTPVDTGPPLTGTLTLAGDVTTAADIDLSALGTADWAHWGKGSVTTFNHRATGGLIASGTALSSLMSTSLAVVTKKYIWSDGTPTASASTVDGVAASANADMYQFEVAASATTLRTLVVYVGSYLKATATVTATLSDGSAIPATATTTGTSGVQYSKFTATFRAGKAGAKLTIKLTKGTAGAGSSYLALHAATLQ
jgi:hypothetical protein